MKHIAATDCASARQMRVVGIIETGCRPLAVCDSIDAEHSPKRRPDAEKAKGRIRNKADFSRTRAGWLPSSGGSAPCGTRRYHEL